MLFRSNFSDDPQPHGHVVVDSSAEFFDESRAHHELMTDYFCISRGFFEGGNMKLGGFHARAIRVTKRVTIRVSPEVSTAWLCIMDAIEKI